MVSKFIQILGTSGTGKTTAMRAVMDRLDKPHTTIPLAHSWQEKKKGVLTGKTKSKTYQLGSVHGVPGNASRLAVVLGSYAAVCGGMDSMSAPGVSDTIYPELERLAAEDPSLIFLMEGLIQCQPGRAIALAAKGHEVHSIVLNTSLEECLRRIQGRRVQAGNNKELDPENTRIKHAAQGKLVERLRAGGVTVHHISGDEAVEKIMELLAA